MTPKPNILILDSTFGGARTPAESRESIANCLIEKNWVYVGEGNRRPVEDNDHGVRFLFADEAFLNRFGRLNLIVVIDDESVAEAVSELRKDAPVFLWRSENHEEEQKKIEKVLNLFGLMLSLRLHSNH